jgi:hypothetical protein
MQFYIVHPDPATSARMLPDYALKQVNLREGWQILSDIGHIHGVTWEGQCKLYSASHALTRLLCSTPERFQQFRAHYECCLLEYEDRFGKASSWDARYTAFLKDHGPARIKDRLPHTEYESVRRYLLEYKADKLTNAEKTRLREGE